MIVHETHTIHDPLAPFSFMSFCLSPLPNNLHRPGNWHEDLEILSVHEGAAAIHIGGDIFDVKKGDIVVFNSNLIHSIIPYEESVSYDCLIISPTFCSENGIELFSTQFVPVFRDERISAMMNRLQEQFPAPHTSPFVLKEENRRLSRFLPQRATITQILSDIYCYHLMSKNVTLSAKDTNESIKQALEFIHANSHRDISLNEISEIVGLSPFYFSREFRRATQVTFVSYVNQVRCNHAKHYLKKGSCSIAEVSTLCGFRNQSYFSKIFLQIEGITPSEYQKRKQEKSN